MSRNTSRIVIATVAGSIAIVSALPVFDVYVVPEWVVVAALPGSIVAMMISGNVHAFNPWIVVTANWVLYAFFILLIRKVARILRAK